ncbi:MAG: hypothetical protein GKR90_25715 [Pseudomonadales bacterium]|nr:hypothetical protein [Pseudomonadales bacterium]
MSNQNDDSPESKSIKYGRLAMLDGIARISSDVSRDWSSKTAEQRAGLRFLIQRCEILFAFILDGNEIELNAHKRNVHLPLDSVATESIWLAQSLVPEKDALEVDVHEIEPHRVVGERNRIANIVAIFIVQSLLLNSRIAVSLETQISGGNVNLVVRLLNAEGQQGPLEEDSELRNMMSHYFSLLCDRLDATISLGSLSVPLELVEPESSDGRVLPKSFTLLSCAEGVHDIPADIEVVFPYSPNAHNADVLVLGHKGTDPQRSRKKTEENLSHLSRWNNLPSILVADRLDHAELSLYRGLVSAILVEPVREEAWRRYAGAISSIDRRKTNRLAEIH